MRCQNLATLTLNLLMNNQKTSLQRAPRSCAWPNVSLTPPVRDGAVPTAQGQMKPQRAQTTAQGHCLQPQPSSEGLCYYITIQFPILTTMCVHHAGLCPTNNQRAAAKHPLGTPATLMASGRIESSDAGAHVSLPDTQAQPEILLDSFLPPHPSLPSVQESCSSTLKTKVGVFLTISAALSSLGSCSSPLTSSHTFPVPLTLLRTCSPRDPAGTKSEPLTQSQRPPTASPTPSWVQGSSLGLDKRQRNTATQIKLLELKTACLRCTIH